MPYGKALAVLFCKYQYLISLFFICLCVPLSVFFQYFYDVCAALVSVINYDDSNNNNNNVHISTVP